MSATYLDAVILIAAVWAVLAFCEIRWWRTQHPDVDPQNPDADLAHTWWGQPE